MSNTNKPNKSKDDTEYHYISHVSEHHISEYDSDWCDHSDDTESIVHPTVTVENKSKLVVKKMLQMKPIKN